MIHAFADHGIDEPSSSPDTFVSGTGAATVSADTGNDLLFALDAPVDFVPGTGSSTVVTGSAATTFTGGDTGGTLMFSNGPTTYTSNGGTDTVDALSGSLTAQGGAGGGIFVGGSAGNNQITAKDGFVTAFGGGAGDVLAATGTIGVQLSLQGAPGMLETIVHDSDLFVGGPGAETLTGAGSASNNIFFAGSGPETLIGGGGQTELVADEESLNSLSARLNKSLYGKV